MVDYKKRLVEVDEILNYLSEEELLKIPEEVKNIIKENKDREYFWKYDISKELKDQNLNRDTIIILSYLNMEYLLTKEQKQLMQQIHKLNERQSEEEKIKKYSTKDLFKDYPKQKVNVENLQQNKEQSLVKYKESFFGKVISKIKKIFIRLK